MCHGTRHIHSRSVWPAATTRSSEGRRRRWLSSRFFTKPIASSQSLAQPESLSLFSREQPVFFPSFCAKAECKWFGLWIWFRRDLFVNWTRLGSARRTTPFSAGVSPSAPSSCSLLRAIPSFYFSSIEIDAANLLALWCRLLKVRVSITMTIIVSSDTEYAQLLCEIELL